MLLKEIIPIIERMHNKILPKYEVDELSLFIENLENKFNAIKPFITKLEILKHVENLSDFKLQYLEKIKFLHFIEDNIFPLNVRKLMALNINNFLENELILKIEFADRIYSLYNILRNDLLSEIISYDEDFRIINVQHLYNNFNNPFLKDQLIKLEYMKKIDFDYWELSEKYENKNFAIFNASRIVSAIDHFFNDKIFIYRKKENTNFLKLNIKFKEDGKLFSGVLEFKDEFKDLSTGWNIVISKKLRLLKTPYEFLSSTHSTVKFIGKNNYRSILDNSSYTQDIFTKSSRYICLELLDKKREENFENTFFLKIMNHIHSYPIKIDWKLLEKLEETKYNIDNEVSIVKVMADIDKERKNKEITWNKQKQANKQVRYLYNKAKGIKNQIDIYNQIFELLKNLNDCKFFIKYKFCTRYRMYPDAGILNYQNFKILRMLFKGETKTKEEIILIYREFFKKHYINADKISENIFFYNKINDENYQSIVKIVEVKLERKLEIKKSKNILSLSDNELWDTILSNYGYHLIYRIGEFLGKTSTSLDNNSVTVNGINIIKNNLLELGQLGEINTEEKSYWWRLLENWNEFKDNNVFDGYLYAFDATTSMIQISSILCFAENEKTLKQCGIMDPFKYGEKVEDAHQTILTECLNRLDNFILKNRLEVHSEIIKRLIDRSFIKTIHIPFSYGQSSRTLMQNLNLKHRNSLVWEKIPTKVRKLLGHFIYNIILVIYKKDMPHILEARETLEEAYRNSSISLGGEMINMPVETDISDDHIEYSNLINKKISIKNNIRKIEINKRVGDVDFYECKIKDLYDKINNIEERIEKIEENYEKNNLIKRISISSIIWDSELRKFKSTNKYKVIYLNQSKEINEKKMNRCAYVNTIQNGDSTVMLLSNKNLMLENTELKVTILWTHDCGNIPLIFADLLEISYKLAIIEMIKYYMNSETDPFEKKEYKIDQKYIQERRKRKKIWIEKDIENMVWGSTRLITSEF